MIYKLVGIVCKQWPLHRGVSFRRYRYIQHSRPDYG